MSRSSLRSKPPSPLLVKQKTASTDTIRCASTGGFYILAVIVTAARPRFHAALTNTETTFAEIYSAMVSIFLVALMKLLTISMTQATIRQTAAAMVT